MFFVKAFRENLPFAVILAMFFAPFLFAAAGSYGKKDSIVFLLLYFAGSLTLSIFLASAVVAVYTFLSILGEKIKSMKEIPGTMEKMSLPGLRERLGRYYDFRGFE